MAAPRGDRVVILGAGFAGLNAAIELARRRWPVPTGQLTLVDRHNYHLFTPMLYQVATGLVEPGHIAYPVRVLARRYGFDFQESTVQQVDLEQRRVMTDDGPLDYDYLAIAVGSVTNFFGMETAQRRSLTLKTIGDAVRLRNHLVDAFEHADVEPDPARRREWLTFVVVGGGATGVELVGSMTTLIREAVLPTFPSIRPGEVRLVLVEAMDRLLPSLNRRQGEQAMRRLQELGVELRLNTAVTEVTDGGVRTKAGELLPARTVIWVAGVRAGALAAQLPVDRGRGGRIVVNQYLEVPGWPGVYVLGDAALATDPKTGAPLPPNAAVAVRQGRHFGRNMAAVLEGSSPRPFRYRSPGELVALGRGAALADIYGIRFDGFLAWLVWRTFYLSQLMGFKNRLAVLLDWSYAYFGRRDITRLEVSTEWAAEAETAAAPARRPPAHRAA